MRYTCENCGHSNKLTRKQRSENIKAGIDRAKASGSQIGRPRIADYEKIRTLRKSGMSHRKIQEELNVTRGSIQYALKGK